jgi:hypothetical protein
MYARGAYAPKQERERIQTLVRKARPAQVPGEPRDYNSPPFRRPARRRDDDLRPAGRLMRGGLRPDSRGDAAADDSSPIQPSLF